MSVIMILVVTGGWRVGNHDVSSGQGDGGSVIMMLVVARGMECR